MTADAEIGPKYPPSSESADCRFLTKSSSAATTWQPLPDGQRTAAAVALARLPHRDAANGNRGSGSADGLSWQRQTALQHGRAPSGR